MEPVPLDQLEHEWRRQLASPQLAARLYEWQRCDRALRPYADPAALLRLFRVEGLGVAKDAVLYALVSIARDDPLAGVVVLQAIMPGLKRLARRTMLDAREREELWAALLSTAWERIRCYPLRRRRRVAANLLLDTMHGALAEMSGQRQARMQLTDDASVLVAEQAVDGDVDGLLERAVQAGALSADDADLILATRIDGRQLADMATATGVSYNTLKVRRQRAERRLLVFLGHRPVPRRPQNRPSFPARVAGAGSRRHRDARRTSPTRSARPWPALRRWPGRPTRERFSRSSRVTSELVRLLLAARVAVSDDEHQRIRRSRWAQPIMIASATPTMATTIASGVPTIVIQLAQRLSCSSEKRRERPFLVPF